MQHPVFRVNMFCRKTIVFWFFVRSSSFHLPCILRSCVCQSIQLVLGRISLKFTKMSTFSTLFHVSFLTLPDQWGTTIVFGKRISNPTDGDNGTVAWTNLRAWGTVCYEARCVGAYRDSIRTDKNRKWCALWTRSKFGFLFLSTWFSVG